MLSICKPELARPTARHPRAGATTLVEVGLVLPVFIIFVFGIVEVARGFMVCHVLANAARSGCRVGILTNKANSDITSAVNSNLAGQVTGQSTTVKVNGVVANASTAQSGDQLTVIVSVPASSVTWLPGAHYLTGNISGEFALRRE